jgi:putative oxidoreductase
MLNGSEWIGILLARLTVGLAFSLSGEAKLFRRSRRDQMKLTLREARIPYPELNAIFVSGVEFVFGSLLVVGALTRLACIMLAAVMVMAIATTRLQSVRHSSAIEWLSNVLYLPEVLYLVILIWLFFSGAGWLSLDHLIIF